MNVIRFPEMISNNKAVILTNKTDKETKDAYSQSIRLLLGTSKKTFFGDPNFGSNIQKYLYDPNGFIMRDIIIDDICTTVNAYIPGVKLERSNVQLTQDRNTVIARLLIKNIVDQSYETYELNLTQTEEV